jgi:uncharacterized HAD superfamily protein
MVIGIDIDDTITNTQGVMFAYAQKYTIEELHKSGKVNNIDNIKTHKYIQALHNWSKEEEENFFKEYYKKTIEETVPFTNCVETLKKLKEDGHTIILITARFEYDDFDVRELTKKWLEEKDIPYDKLIINAETKRKAAEENNVDVFIDDSFTNCMDVAESGITTFIMDGRYNSKLNDERITRVYSWANILENINKLEQNLSL